MLKGIYAAAAGMTGELIRNDVIAENLANITTPGYKTAQVSVKSFGDMLVSKLKGDAASPLGHINQGSEVLGTHTVFQAGAMVQTGNPLDLALNGDGFFVVKPQSQDGDVAYTRAGNFTIDAQGFLSTTDGSRVQGDNGDIAIPREVSRIELSQSGELFGNGQSLGRVKIAQFDDNAVLKRYGANIFTTEESPKSQAQNVSISQGMIEQSNSQAVVELTNSITALRAYEMMQKTVQMQNETLGRAINDVGKVT